MYMQISDMAYLTHKMYEDFNNLFMFSYYISNLFEIHKVIDQY